MKLFKRINYQIEGQKTEDFLVGLALTGVIFPILFVFLGLALLGMGNIYVLMLRVFPCTLSTIIVGLLIYLGITRYWAAFGLLTGLVGLSLFIWWNLHLAAPWAF